MHTHQKRYYAILFALPALLVILLLRIPPILQGIILPFKQYSFAKGLLGSPWIGLENFKTLISGSDFRQVLGNTLKMNLLFFLIAAILALVIGLSLSQVRFHRLYACFCVLFCIPFFIPQMYWNVLLSKLFSTQGWVNGLNAEPKLYLADAGIVRILYIAIEVLRWTGLFAVVISFISRRSSQKRRMSTALKALFAISLISISFILITDFELLYPLVNPIILQKMDTLTLYGFRAGFIMGDLSLAGSLWFIQSLFCFIALAFLLLAGGSFIKKLLFTNSGSDVSELSLSQPGNGVEAVIIPAVYSFILLLVFVIMIISLTDIGHLVQMNLFIRSVIIYSILAVVTSVIGILLVILLAYPFTTATSPVLRKLYTIVFIFFIAASQFGVQDFIHIKSLGMINTYFPIILTGIFNPVYVILLGTYYNQKTGDTPSGFGQYFIKSLPAIACIFIASLLINLDSFTSSLVYMTKTDMQSPTMQILMGISRPR